MNPQYVFDPRLGVIVYRGAIPNAEGLIDKLETALENLLMIDLNGTWEQLVI